MRFSGTPWLGHIRQLIARQSIETPPEGTRAFARGDAPATIQPSDLIIVEGHLILWDAALRDLIDVKLFVDVEPHERVLRRLLRDVAQRGGDLEGAVAWYRRDVIPNFPVYTEPCKAYADIVVPFLDENTCGVADPRFRITRSDFESAHFEWNFEM